MGVDVAVSELRDLIPTEKLGSSTLVFILDRNGDVIFFEKLNGDAEDYLDRIRGVSEVDFFDLWPKQEKDVPAMKVRLVGMSRVVTR